MKWMNVRAIALLLVIATAGAADPITNQIAAGDYRGALSSLDAVAAENRDAQWHLLASKAWDGLNDPARAVDEAQRAIDLAPRSEAARIQLAQIFLSRNTPAAAWDIFSEAMPEFPDSALIRLGAGLALNQMRRYSDAIPILKNCLNMRPDLGPAFDALASAYLNSGDYETLLREASQYSRAHPVDFRGFYYEASARVELSMDSGDADVAETERLLRTSIRLNTKFAAAHTLLGRILLQRNRAEEAVPELTEAVRLRPAYAPAHLYLAAACRKLGKTDQARQESEIVSRLNQEESRPVPHLLYHRGARPAHATSSDASPDRRPDTSKDQK